MGFSKLKSATTSKAPEPEPVQAEPVQAEPVQAEPEPNPEPTEPTSTPAVRDTAQLVPSGVVGNALSLIAGDDDEPGFTDVFPTIRITGGNGGGTAVPSKSTDPEIADALPQGRQKFPAVYMAFRTSVLAWPSDFDDDTVERKPAWKLSVPAHDAGLVARVRKACENFNYCPNKDKWRVANGGPGHIRPVFEILAYLPAIDEVVVLQNPPGLKSWETMAGQLAPFADDDGWVHPFPAIMSPKSDEWFGDNLYHYWQFSNISSSDAEPALAKYAATMDLIRHDHPEVKQDVSDWYECADAPLTDEVDKFLTQACAMTNPRRSRR